MAPKKKGLSDKYRFLRQNAIARFLPALRFVVGVWRGYVDLHRLALIALFVLAAMSGELISPTGVLLLLALALYLGLVLADKWLRKVDD